MADVKAQDVVDKLRDAIANTPGVERIRVDGLEAWIDISQLDYWERKAARENTPRSRPIAATILLNRE